MRRKAFAARVWARLVANEKELRLLPPNGTVLAAVSGGPDSVCLAHFLAALSRRKGFALALAYVDHGLRKEAASEARFVEALGRSLKAPVFVLKADVAAAARRRGAGTEDAARIARYEALSKLARERGFSTVAAGHHLDDQAETFLLHLLRSEKASSLGAMTASRELAPGVRLVRPLLAISRDEVKAYLEVHGLKSRTDRSNRSPKYLRNWVRMKLLPLLASKQPRIREHLALLSGQIRALTTADKP